MAGEPAVAREGNGSDCAGAIGAATAGIDGPDAADGVAIVGADPTEGTSAGSDTPAWIAAGAAVSGGAAADGAVTSTAGAGAASILLTWMGSKPAAGAC